VYVHTKVVEPIMIQHMTAGDDPDLAWKLGGIYGGKDVVKAFWELGAGTAELLEWFSGTTFKNMSRKLAFGSFFMPSNQHTLVQIGEFIQRTAELEIKRSTAGMLEDHENKHVELMRQMIGSMQKMVTVGKKLDHPDGYETRVYDGLVQHVLHPERYGEVEKEVDAVVSGG